MMSIVLHFFFDQFLIYETFFAVNTSSLAAKHKPGFPYLGRYASGACRFVTHKTTSFFKFAKGYLPLTANIDKYPDFGGD